MRGRSSSGILDPFALAEFGSLTPYLNRTGRVEITDPSIVPGETTVLMMVTDQSTGANDRPTPYAVNNAKIQQLDIYNGKVYQLTDPMLGPNGSGGCQYTKAARMMVDDGIVDRFILMNCARSGAGSFRWVGYRQPQDWFYHHMIVACRRARALGFFQPNPDLRIGLTYGVGVSDVGVTSAAQFRTNALDLFAGVADQGFVGDIFINISTMQNSVADPTIATAQGGLWSSVNRRREGANMDAVNGAYLRDGTHRTDAGYDQTAGRIRDAWAAVYA